MGGRLEEVRDRFDLTGAVAIVILSVITVGCSGTHRPAAPTPRAADTVAALRQRPLRLPSLRANGACPVSRSWSEPSPNLAGMLGDGPARPVGLNRDAILGYVRPAPENAYAGSDWGGNKVLWAVAPEVTTPVLVRGHQLNGSGEVRFGTAVVPETELVLPPPTNRESTDHTLWRDFPNATRLQHPGCYGYQVDSRTTSLVIVFDARQA